MNRKQELQILIAAIARRISRMTESIGNGNTDEESRELMELASVEMRTYQTYIYELIEIEKKEK